MQRGPDGRAIAALAVALAILTVSALLNQADMDRISDAQARVTRYSETKHRLQSALTELHRAESSARGYLLAGSAPFADEFRDARQRLAADWADLDTLTSDDPSRAEQIHELQGWASVRLDVLDAQMARRRSGAPMDADAVKADSPLIGRIHEQAEALTAAEDGFLKLSRKQANASREGIHTTFLVTSLLSALFVLFAFVLVLRILADREETAERIRDANERFKLAADAVQGAIYDWNMRTGELVRADQFYEMIGQPPSEIPASREWWREQVHPDDLPGLSAEFKKMLESESHFGFEYRLKHRDGHYIPVWDKGVVLRDSEGTPVRIVGSTMDITDRVEAERKRRLSDALVEQMLESSQDCIVAVDMDSKLVLMNSHGQESLGILDFNTRKGSPWEELWSEEDRPHATEAVEMARRGDVGRFQGRLPAADGSQRWWDVMATPIMDADGVVNRVLTVARDFTEERTAREALEDRQQEIEDLNRRLQRAVAESHHRIKNNLQVLVSLVETMRFSVNRSAPPGELERLARHIRGLAVLHDLLTSETRTPNTDLDTVPVRGILERLIPVLEMAAGSQRGACDIEDIRLTLKQCSAMTLLVNELISNALKHGAGTVSLTLRREPTDKGPEIFLVISDDGPGFPPDFAPAKAANTGLDLIESIGRWDLGGDIRYANGPDGGGQVTLCFPVTPPGAVPLPDSVDPNLK